MYGSVQFSEVFGPAGRCIGDKIRAAHVVSLPTRWLQLLVVALLLLAVGAMSAGGTHATSPPLNMGNMDLHAAVEEIETSKITKKEAQKKGVGEVDTEMHIDGLEHPEAAGEGAKIGTKAGKNEHREEKGKKRGAKKTEIEAEIKHIETEIKRNKAEIRRKEDEMEKVSTYTQKMCMIR
jgi:hypothetical protein